MSPGRARPFLTGAVGLTRFASQGDDEIRFTVSAGGGVKLFATEHLALRLDGRGYATLVNGEGDATLLRTRHLHRIVRRLGRVAGGVYCFAREAEGRCPVSNALRGSLQIDVETEVR